MRCHRGSKLLRGVGAACCLLGGAQAAQASSAEILCFTVHVVECDVATACEKTSALTADAPRFLRVKLDERTIETIREGDRRQTTEIKGMARSDGLILLQGVEPARKGERSALGWTMSLDEASGDMVITASGRDVGYTLFGACTAID